MSHDQMFPEQTKDLAEQKARLAMDNLKAWRKFSRTVFSDGALSAKTKEIIAVAVSHVTQCPYCIRAHTKNAIEQGATREELMEAIWVAAEMRAGAAYSHANIAMDEMLKMEENGNKE